MNTELADELSDAISKTYLDNSINNIRQFDNKWKHVVKNKCLPDNGFQDIEIRHLLYNVSLMDNNNFIHTLGAGEREGKVINQLIRERHYGFAHGIGRSGNITDVQPKAAGSSFIYQTANHLALQVLKLAGVKSTKAALVLPFATGMALSLCLMVLKANCVHPKEKVYVLWLRIDQKSCFKSIITAGLQPLIVEPIRIGDELQTNVDAVESILAERSHEILCVMSITSCFAPRVPDNLMKLSALCSRFDVGHLVNNAYGVMLPRCMNLIEEAQRIGRIDYFVQSTDKNFLVPVGGAIVAAFDERCIRGLADFYPGRASLTPAMDLFVTLLSLGRNGITQLISQQHESFLALKDGLEGIAHDFGGRVLDTAQHNPISLALTLDHLSSDPDRLKALGSRLFVKGCSGARIVVSAKLNDFAKVTVSGYDFVGFGSHSQHSTESYLNVAAGVGQTREEVDAIIQLLRCTLRKKTLFTCCAMKKGTGYKWASIPSTAHQ